MKTYVSASRGRLAHRQTGFTLLELMIVVVVIGIIAAIGYPSYQGQAQKTRRSSAQIALTEVANRLEKFYTQCSTYTNNMALTDVWPQTAGISECNPANAIAAGIGINYGTATPDGYYTLAITDLAGGAGALGVGYKITATAAGIQLADTKCATLTLDSVGNKQSTPAGATDCWK